MRYSLPIALALAAVTVASVSGTATAFNNNSNPWTAPLFKDQPIKPPKANANQNSSATQSTTNSPATPSKPPKGNTNQNPSATQTTLNAPATTSGPPAQKPAAKPPTVAELQKDIAKQQKEISIDQASLAFWQKQLANDPDFIKKAIAENKFHWDPKDPKQMRCDTAGKCVAFETWQVGDGRSAQTFEIPVSATGHAIAGTADAIIATDKAMYEALIDYRKNEIAAAQAQMAADYAANPQAFGGGTVQVPKESTALHQN